MKLLFDANLSPALIGLLADVYPGSVHVLFLGLGPAPSDDAIWAYALEHNYVIVSKDADFYRLSTVAGAPPKVVWLRVGNGPTLAIEAHLRRSLLRIVDFVADSEAALLVIGARRAV